MNPCRTLAVIGLATCLAAGTFALGACSAQSNPDDAHSANTDEAANHASAAADQAKAAAQDAKGAVSDAWITTKVKSELATTKGIESTNVSVATVDGVVTLTGVLPTDTSVDKAVAAAKSVQGVKDVDASGLKSKD